jgi:hypothetical protein
MGAPACPGVPWGLAFETWMLDDLRTPLDETPGQGIPSTNEENQAPTIVDGQESKAWIPSVITLKPAIRYHFKTGQRNWPKT